MTTSSADPKDAIGQAKPSLALLPPAFQAEVSKALALGASKYGPWNWRKGDGVKLSTYLSAMKRHIDYFVDEESIDPESGAHHLGHVAANCAIILDALKHGKLIDDMPPKPEPVKAPAREIIEELLRSEAAMPYQLSCVEVADFRCKMKSGEAFMIGISRYDMVARHKWCIAWFKFIEREVLIPGTADVHRINTPNGDIHVRIEPRP